MRLQVDPNQIKGVVAFMHQIGENANKEIRIAIGKAAAKSKTKAAKKLQTVLNVKQSILKKAVRIQRPKDDESLSMTIRLAYGYKIPLKYFGAVDHRAEGSGVSVRMHPKAKKPTNLRQAFIVNRFKGHVFQRKGKKRGPIGALGGPAPGEVYESSGASQAAEQTAKEQLPKQINERLRFLIVRARGQLRGKQRS
jgi:hypothetical protein